MKKGRLQEGLFRRKDQWVLICGFTTTEWSSTYKTYLEVSSLLFVGPSSLMTKRHSMHICGRGECSPFLPFFYVLRSSSFFLLRKHLWHGWPQCVVGFFDLLAKWPTSVLICAVDCTQWRSIFLLLGSTHAIQMGTTTVVLLYHLRTEKDARLWRRICHLKSTWPSSIGLE